MYRPQYPVSSIQYPVSFYDLTTVANYPAQNDQRKPAARTACFRVEGFEVLFDFIKIMVQTRSWTIGLATLLWSLYVASAASTFDQDKRDDYHNIMDEYTTDVLIIH
jgi:hypothetical protein